MVNKSVQKVSISSIGTPNIDFCKSNFTIIFGNKMENKGRKK